MKEADQVEMFAGELDKLVYRFAEEFELTYAAIVGALQMKSHALCAEAMAPDDDDEEIGFELDDE